MLLNLDEVCVDSPTAMTGESPLPLVDKITMAVEAGEVVAIIGPNGAGKSTLMKALSGDLPYRGNITLQGRSPRAIEAARQLAALPQQSLLNFPYRVCEVVGLGRIPHATGRELDEQIISEALELMDVGYLRDRIYTELSGGEKQRVQLARVLAQIWRAEDAPNKTRLLLLDEPTASLDLGHQKALLEAVVRFAGQGVSVVMVLHDINLAARYADKVLAMVCSQQVAFGPANEVIDAALVQRLFGLAVHVTSHPDSGTPVVIPA
jgi:iron complex transport system ATP-binding protein